MIVEVSKDFEFSSAHFLPNYDGKCRNMHGHNYKLRVTVRGDVEHFKGDPKEGMVLDFSELKRLVNENIIDQFDHAILNIMIEVPTAENIAMVIFQKLKKLFAEKSYRVSRVDVWETSDSIASVFEE